MDNSQAVHEVERSVRRLLVSGTAISDLFDPGFHQIMQSARSRSGAGLVAAGRRGSSPSPSHTGHHFGSRCYSFIAGRHRKIFGARGSPFTD